MMNNAFNRISGYLLIFAAILGLILSLTGLTLTWVVKPVVTESLQSSLNLIETSLTSTSKGLELIQQSLQTLKSSVMSIEGTLQTASQTIEDTLPVMDTLETLLDDELPTTVESVQTSLNTAYETAEVINNVLVALTFLNRDLYNPEVPLHTSLANISESMNSLPVSFSSMAENIKNTSHNMQVMQVDVVMLKDAVRQIETSLDEYDKIITEYRQTIDRVLQEVQKLNDRLVSAITWLALGLTFFFIWMATAQLGLFNQGMALIRNDSALRK